MINRHPVFFNAVGIDILDVVYQFIKVCLFQANDAVTEQQQQKEKKTNTEDKVGIRSKC